MQEGGRVALGIEGSLLVGIGVAQRSVSLQYLSLHPCLLKIRFNLAWQHLRPYICHAVELVGNNGRYAIRLPLRADILLISLVLLLDEIQAKA